MQLEAPPYFFIVRIDRQKQRETREFDGFLANSPNYIYMQHEVQNGEIVSIGSKAQQAFPNANIGQILIFHHFVTGKGIEDKEESPYIVFQDEKYNYYNVTAETFNGERNMSYGIWDGEKIIPHKDFIFLKVIELEKEVTKIANLIELKNWSESRDKKTERMKGIKNSIVELTKTDASENLKNEIEKREKRMNQISKEINKKEIKLYEVAYSNLPFNEVGVLNIAAHTKVSFMNTEYLVAQIKYTFFGNSNN